MSDVDYSDEEFVDLEEVGGLFTDEQLRLTQRLGSHLDSKDGTLGVAHSTIFLDPEQVNVLRGVYAQLRAKEKSMYIEAPTGFGKTVVILKLLEILTKDGKPPRIFIAVPDIDALETWRNALEEMEPILAEMGIDPFSNIGFYYEDQKDTDKAITIGTMTSMVMTNQNQVFGDDHFDLIIVDEGHAALSELRGSMLAKSLAVRIYLSATPSYTRAKSLENIAKCAYRCAPDYAEKLKLVAPYQNIVVAQPEISLDESMLNSGGDLSPTKLASKAKEVKVNELLLNFYRNEVQPHNGQPFFGTHGIVNCFNVEDTIATAAEINEALKGQLPEGVIAAVALHGKTPTEERRAAKKLYREGKILMLCGMRLLTHSFHDPRTTFVWNKLPSSSGVQVGQRGGRARSVSRDPNAPPKMAYIIDVLYRNVRLGSWQILYGEYMRGFLLDEAGKKPTSVAANDDEGPETEEKKKTKKKPVVFDINLLTAGQVLKDPEQIRALYTERARLYLQLRPPPVWSKNFPTLWTVAKKQGYFSTRMLYDAIAAMGETGHNLSKTQNVLSGIVDFYDNDLCEWHPTAVALSRLLKRHVCDLFPISGRDVATTPNPKALRRRANREAINAILAEEGYEGIGDFAKKSGMSPQRVHNVCSDGVDNYGPQGWNADSWRVAEILGRSPEALFGMPDEIRAIHELIAMKAEEQGTAPGWPLDPFFAQSAAYDQEAALSNSGLVAEFHRIIAEALASGTLTERQWRVIQQRHGIGAFEEMTLDEVATPEGVTRERIRQIELKGTRILKFGERGRRLRNLFTTLDS